MKRSLARAASSLAFLLAFLPAAGAWGQYGQQQPYGQQQQPSPGLEAGGLAPPPPVPQSEESAATEDSLEKAEEEDSGRGLEFFYLNTEIGVEHLGLQTFTASNLVDPDIVQTSQTGLLVGVGLGLRLVFITLGPRFRIGMFDAWQLWTLNAELGLRIPLGAVEPYFTLGGGYASLGSLTQAGISADITGYDIRIGGGLDYYVTPVFSLGVSVTGEVLGLSRPGVSAAQLQAAPSSRADIYRADGSSLGFGVTGTAVLGLHF